MGEIVMNPDLLNSKSTEISLLLDQYRVSRPVLPEIYGSGSSVKWIWQMLLRFEILDREMEMLLLNTGGFLNSMANSFRQSDLNASKQFTG